jgi:hypothetical protein
MPQEEMKAVAYRMHIRRENAVQFVAVAVAMAMLAGCAVTVPLRLADTQGEGICSANLDPECADGGSAYRPTPSANQPNKPSS